MKFTVLLTFLSLLFLSACGTRRNGASTPFQLVTSIDNNRVTMTCTEGCAFEELTFTAAQDFPRIVTFYGLAGKEPNDQETAFAFVLRRTATGVRLKSVRGTTWSELEYGCGYNDCSFVVDQFGIRGR